MPMTPEKDTQWVHEEDYGSFGLVEAAVGLFQIIVAVVMFVVYLFRRK